MSERRENYINLKDYLDEKFRDIKDDLKKLNNDHDIFNTKTLENSQKIEQVCKDLEEHKRNHKYWLGTVLTVLGLGGIADWLTK